MPYDALLLAALALLAFVLARLTGTLREVHQALWQHTQALVALTLAMQTHTTQLRRATWLVGEGEEDK